MAGIGFELRKLLRRESYMGLLQAYGFAGIISSGPWVLSILGVMLVGIISIGRVFPAELIVQFLVSVTYLMAFSLIFTGFLQLMFTRYIADRIFEKKDDIILANLIGVLTLVTIVGGISGFIVLFMFFDQDIKYRLLMLSGFITLSNIWIVVVFLSGMKAYRLILTVFFIGYSVTVFASIALEIFGLNGLLAGFVIGQVVLLFLMLAMVIYEYPGKQLISFDFLNRKKIFISLALTGFFYNLGIWVDKFIFWFNPITSDSIIGPLRASVIYDIPIFLAYLSIIPGMAVFLVRMETDFAEAYNNFYTSVREGDTLNHIEQLKDEMVITIRQGIYEIFKVQGLTVVLLYLLGSRILEWIGISPLYIHLFQIDIAAVGVQVLLLAILNVLFYLDFLLMALGLCFLFTVCNTVFTFITLELGPQFYGYGFAMALVLTSLIGLALLSRKLDRLEYETFMLQ